MLFAQLLANGLQTGALYALIAAGFSLIFGMTRIFHAAHGATFTIAGFVFYECYAVLGWAWPLAALASAAAAGLFGVTNDIIASTDSIIIPQQAEPLGIRSVPKLLEGLNRLRIINPRLNVLGVCLTMIQLDLPDSTEAASALRELLPAEMLFQTTIPRADIFVRASARGLPVAILEGSEGAETVFDSLRSEIQIKLAKTNHNSSYQAH